MNDIVTENFQDLWAHYLPSSAATTNETTFVSSMTAAWNQDPLLSESPNGTGTTSTDNGAQIFTQPTTEVVKLPDGNPQTLPGEIRLQEAGSQWYWSPALPNYPSGPTKP
jgi:pyocin large subunit-like protein